MSSPGEAAGLGREALDRLSFRRQFVLGPALPPTPPGWRRVSVDPRHQADVHPDLELCQAGDGARRLTLFGYAIDANEPRATHAAILARLLAATASCAEVPPATASLGGRWVLVAHDGARSILFGDACGLRQAYYCASGPAPVLCASQPGPIAEALGLQPDEAAVDYVRSRGEEDNEVYWLPGDASPYARVRAVLPNHYLDLDSGATTRFWPAADVQPVAREAAVAESLRLLRGLIEGASRRYPLSISLTAGWDSRLMLALCRDVAQDLYAFTLTYPGVPDDVRDVRVPARLLPRLGLAHHLVRYPEAIDAGLREVCKRNTASLTRAWCADVQALREQSPADRVCVTGDVAEIFKCHYRLPAGSPLGPRELAAVCKLPPHPFVLDALARWLSGAAPRNVHLLDLFCWEQMGGRWQALIRAEYDVAQESFAPLDCRALLTTLLGVDERERRGPEFRILRELIERLWSEVLAEPINPRERVRPKELLVKLLTRLHLYQLVPPPLIRLAKRLLGS